MITSLLRQLKWRIALYVFLGTVGWGIIHRLSGPGVDDTIHQRQVTAVLKAGKAYRAQQMRDHEEIARLRRTAASHIGKADTLRAKRLAIPLPPVIPPEALPYSLHLDLAVAETVELRDALHADSVALDTAAAAINRAEVRADTLETLLSNSPKPCRVLGVACPRLAVGVFVDEDLEVKAGIGVVIPIHF